jgi:hypothetical protein
MRLIIVVKLKTIKLLVCSSLLSKLNLLLFYFIFILIINSIILLLIFALLHNLEMSLNNLFFFHKFKIQNFLFTIRWIIIINLINQAYLFKIRVYLWFLNILNCIIKWELKQISYILLIITLNMMNLTALIIRKIILSILIHYLLILTHFL